MRNTHVLLVVKKNGFVVLMLEFQVVITVRVGVHRQLYFSKVIYIIYIIYIYIIITVKDNNIIVIQQYMLHVSVYTTIFRQECK
jgi:hypothetical protein